MRFLYARARRSRIADIAVFAIIVLVILAVLRFLPNPEPLRVSGRAHLIDGDSLSVQGMEMRLKGIDAPEIEQNCSRAGAAWSCGREAVRALRQMLRGRIVDCEGDERDVHDRLLATCRLGGKNINRWMVEQGWAVSFHGFPAEERAARQSKRGIWSGSFIRPRDWREENR